MKSMLLKEVGVAQKNQMMMIKKIAQTKMPIMEIRWQMLMRNQTVMMMIVKKNNGKNNNSCLPN